MQNVQGLPSSDEEWFNASDRQGALPLTQFGKPDPPVEKTEPSFPYSVTGETLLEHGWSTDLRISSND